MKDTDQKTGLNERRDFYVYAWLRPCGTPFYVGKGRGSRAWSMHSRSKIFKHIVVEILTGGGVPSVKILQSALSEPDAFNIEAALICKFGRMENGGVLCNLTDGGEGFAGLVKSEDQVTKSSRSKRKDPPKGLYKGVSFHKKSGKWRAYIQISGEKIHLGNFSTGEEAAKAYDFAAKSEFGEDCYLNFPDDRLSALPKKLNRYEASHALAPKSGYKGVWKHKKSWNAKISANGVIKHLGSFASDVDAALAYDYEARKIGPDVSYLNFPDTVLEFAPKSISISDANRMRRPKGKYKGVCYDKARGKYAAAAKVNGKVINIGRFATEEDAARAYDALMIRSGENCYLNFPPVNENQPAPPHEEINEQQAVN